MKKILLIGLFGLIGGAASAEFLVGWDGVSASNPSNDTLGVSGILFAVNVDSTRGSSDGWFGPDDQQKGGYPGATKLVASGYRTNEGGVVIDFQIRNNSRHDLKLTSILFDYQSIYESGPQKVNVYYAYGALEGIKNNTLLHTFDAPGQSRAPGAKDYLDFSLALEPILSDYILGHGEVATFRISGVAATNPGVNGIVDNIAFIGKILP